MERLIDFLASYDWNSPVNYVFLLMFWMAVIRKWSLFAVIAVTYALGRIFHDFIVMNIRTMMEVATLPMVIYCTGGVLFAVLAGFFFVRFMIS